MDGSLPQTAVRSLLRRNSSSGLGPLPLGPVPPSWSLCCGSLPRTQRRRLARQTPCTPHVPSEIAPRRTSQERREWSAGGVTLGAPQKL